MNTNKVMFYLTRLSNIKHENVLLNTDEMSELIGEAKVEELCLFKLNLTTDLVGKRKRNRSLIPQHKRFKQEPLAKFNRVAIINELQATLTS